VREPRISICQLTVPDSTFEEDLDLIAAAGLPGIAISESKIREGDEDSLLAAFRSSGLEATVCIPDNLGVLPIYPTGIYDGPDDPDARVKLMCDSVRRLAPFEPDSIVVTTGSDASRNPEEAVELVVEGLRKVADVAAEHGTRLGVEACRRDLGFDASFVQGISATVELLDKVDHPNVGLCYDVYHHWDEPEAEKRLAEVAKRVVGVQLGDWREPTRSAADRLLPGDGSIDLPALVKALETGGYSGWYDLEVFSDDGRWGTELPDALWSLPSAELVSRGAASMRSTLAEAGIDA
jgi:sugar phosphate isomerase/epimerase